MTFPAFGSIPRLHRHFTITEKIDGTNGLIAIVDRMDPTPFPHGEMYPLEAWNEPSVPGLRDIRHEWVVGAGSRNRWLKDNKQEDNHGFAAWVAANARTLAADLGPGLHYGEWWGSGIGRGYDLPKGEKRFSLFNTKRWGSNGRVRTMWFTTPGLGVVPVLFDSAAYVQSREAQDTWVPVAGTEFDGMTLEQAVLTKISTNVRFSLEILKEEGSQAAPGFMRPEGIIVYHSAANQYFKVTLEKDDIPKTVAAKQQKQKVSA